MSAEVETLRKALVDLFDAAETLLSGCGRVPGKREDDVDLWTHEPSHEADLNAAVDRVRAVAMQALDALP